MEPDGIDYDHLLVDTTLMEFDHYTVYGANGRDVAVSYTNNNDELVVFEMSEKNSGIDENQTLMGIPDGDKSFETQPDELHAIITALANFHADRPIFADYFLSVRELWKIAEMFNNIPIPQIIGDLLVDDKDDINDINTRVYALFFGDKIAEHEMSLDERVIRMMMVISARCGNFHRVFRRYIVISDEPITTDDLDEAMLEKIKVSGKLIDSRSDPFL